MSTTASKVKCDCCEKQGLSTQQCWFCSYQCHNYGQVGHLKISMVETQKSETRQNPWEISTIDMNHVYPTKQDVQNSCTYLNVLNPYHEPQE